MTLQPITQDEYDRLVAVVYLDGENVNAWMVQQGHAWAYRRYLDDAQYCAWEQQARAKGLGLWSLPSSERIAPWEYRKAEREQTQIVMGSTVETETACVAAMNDRGPVTEPRRPSHQRPRGRAGSRATSTTKAIASTTCPEASRTSAPASARVAGSAGFARRKRRGRRGGGRRGGEFLLKLRERRRLDNRMSVTYTLRSACGRNPQARRPRRSFAVRALVRSAARRSGPGRHPDQASPVGARSCGRYQVSWGWRLRTASTHRSRLSRVFRREGPDQALLLGGGTKLHRRSTSPRHGSAGSRTEEG